MSVPGSDKPATLTEGASLPNGTVVDARGGAVRLISAADSAGTPQAAVFSGAVFSVAQAKRSPLTDLIVRGFDKRSCSAGKGRGPGATKAGRRRSRLWGRGRGRWRTRGRRGSASVRGTVWMTEDTCKGTRFKVRSGKVYIRDFTNGRRLFLTKGQIYLAAPKKRR